MKKFSCKFDLTRNCSFLLLQFISSMSYEIISVYTKVWTTGFAVSFLHDSAHCEHCFNGGIHIPEVTDTSVTNHSNSPEKGESQSFFAKARLQALVVEHNSIPESCYSPLGIKVSAAVLEKLKQQQELKSPEKKQPLKRQLSKRMLLADLKKHCRLNKDLTNKKNSDNRKEGYSETIKSKKLCNTNKKLCKKILATIPILKVSPRKENKTHTLKKSITPPKIKIPKEPGFGTLKRRRWQLDKLKQSDVRYEDDIFENDHLLHFQSVMDDGSDSEKYEKMSTPRIHISPIRDTSNIPDDSYSPSEIISKRKIAEEYIYRREKRRRMQLLDEESESDSFPEEYKNSEEYTTKTLQDTCKILNQVVLKPEEDSDSDEEKDYYYSDVSD